MTLDSTLWLDGDGVAPGDPGATALSVAYSAREDRQLLAATYTEGVVGLDDFKVTAGAGKQVNVAAGWVVVQGDDNTGQGNYLQHNTGTMPVDIGDAPGANSRIDVVYLKVNDDTEDGGGSNIPALAVQVGTAGAVPVAPAIPDTAVALAEVTVGVGDLTSADYVITDVRPRAVPRALPFVLPRYESTALIGGTGGFTTPPVTALSLDVPRQGFPYRLDLAAAVGLLVSGSGVLRIEIKVGSTALRRASDYEATTGSQSVTAQVNDGHLDVLDGSAKTITVTVERLSGTAICSTLNDTAVQYLRAQVFPIAV